MNDILKEMPGFYRFEAFWQKGILAGFSRDRLNFCRENNSGLTDNFKKIFEPMELPFERVITVRQKHTDKIYHFKDFNENPEVIEADAIVTKSKRLPIAVRIADCPAVYIFDVENGAIALVHSGWRGAEKEITSKTISFLKDTFGSKEEFLLAGISVAIRDCCYEVGEDLRGLFNNITSRDDKLFLDLAEELKDELQGRGIKKENIFDAGLCSCCRKDDFFSFRRENTDSRNLAFMAIV